MWDNPFVDSIGGEPSCFFLDHGSNVHDNVFIGTAAGGAGVGDPLFGQVLCNLHQLLPADQLCNGAVYPQQRATFALLPLPPQPTMPNPFAALPRTIPWCAPGHN